MSNFKLMTVVGTRPEIIKLSAVIPLLDEYLDQTLVHTGQNYDYELNEIFFEQLNVRKPDYFLEAMVGSPSKTIGDIIIKIDDLFEECKPDALLVYGDTNSCLCVIPAKRRKIPIFHMEAGNRCFDQRVPEEINRKIVDHLSDINMPLSEHARRYLINEGIKPETIVKTGSPMPEVMNLHMEAIENNQILDKENLTKDEYFLMSIHREENVDSEENFSNLLDSIESLARTYNLPIIISTHPRTKKKLEEINYKEISSLIRFSKPFGFHEYNNLQMNAFCVISDSGTIAEESSIFGLAAVTIRQAHERPEAADEGSFIMSGLNAEILLDAVEIVTKQKKLNNVNKVSDYLSSNVSMKVLRTIMSYTHYINRTVWKK